MPLKPLSTIFWDDTFEPVSRETLVDAPSFQAWIRRILHPALLEVPYDHFLSLRDGRTYPRTHPSKVEGKLFGWRRLPPEKTLMLKPGGFDVCFTKAVYLPVLYQISISVNPFTLKPNLDTWMSLSPMEVYTQRPGLARACGRVMVGGLGLGWFARKLCEKSEVTEVHVFEYDPDVYNFFGPWLALRYPGKLMVIRENAYNACFDNFDSVLFDIWAFFGEVHRDPKFLSLKAQHPSKVWGWAEDYPYGVD